MEGKPIGDLSLVPIGPTVGASTSVLATVPQKLAFHKPTEVKKEFMWRSEFFFRTCKFC